MYDVAERASVSIATVSFTYTRPDKVKPATRERVLAAAQDLGYVPSASARGLAHGRTGALGLFAFDYLIEQGDASRPMDGPARSVAEGRDAGDTLIRSFPLYVDEVQRGIELECWARGYALLLNGGGRADSEAVVADIAGRVDGLAVFPNTVPHEVLLQIARRIPVVELGAEAFSDQLGHVTVDNVTAMRSLTDHLLKVHELVELQFVGDAPTSDNRARFEGFRLALISAGLPAPQRPLSKAQVPDLISRGAVPQGLVCCNDVTALTVMDAVAAHGLQAPRDVAVTGFDGILAGRVSRPMLTTVRQPMEEMGRAVVDVLINQLGARDRAPEHRQLSASLVLRESCGCTA
ncbi:LacI family DNA-binding transcriptional regulator [Phycicoccus sp. Soil803]|uniref:LacI family DNA-binding transcriptional regulator n=1 Tax=Phycicoccus sp. Soil803 TaxID=1736415 RepID=UPI001F198F84|nr:LacI family DNA-binding transcriptional regulator [Phycicoccus sp. Soil803]